MNRCGGSSFQPRACFALAADPGKRWDIVLTNPPFGRKQSARVFTGDGEAETERENYERPRLRCHHRQQATQFPATGHDDPGADQGFGIGITPLVGIGIGKIVQRRRDIGVIRTKSFLPSPLASLGVIGVGVGHVRGPSGFGGHARSNRQRRHQVRGDNQDESGDTPAASCRSRAASSEAA